jgi:hypothetical protein
LDSLHKNPRIKFNQRNLDQKEGRGRFQESFGDLSRLTTNALPPLKETEQKPKEEG